MINPLGFGLMLAFGIAWLNSAYNYVEQLIDYLKPSWKSKWYGGTFIVFAISFLLFIIILYIVYKFP
jgi:hypothetical protein